MPDALSYLLKRSTPLMLCLLLASCAWIGGGNDEPPAPPSLSDIIDEAAQRMLSDYPELSRYTPMIAAAFVDIDDLSSASTFGHISSELFSSELSRSGIAVREVKLRNGLYARERAGELALSHEVRQLVERHDARAIVAGTYAVGQQQAYISIRIVRASDSLVLGTTRFSLTLDNQLRSLLGNGF